MHRQTYWSICIHAFPFIWMHKSMCSCIHIRVLYTVCKLHNHVCDTVHECLNARLWVCTSMYMYATAYICLHFLLAKLALSLLSIDRLIDWLIDAIIWHVGGVCCLVSVVIRWHHHHRIVHPGPCLCRRHQWSGRGRSDRPPHHLPSLAHPQSHQRWPHPHIPTRTYTQTHA